jgi:hypothetical protein
MKRTWLVATISAVAWGFLMLPAQAAPVSGAMGGVQAAVGESAGLHKVHRRWHRHRHYYRPYRYHRHHYYPRRYKYRWYRPGFHFHFGPRRHHRHYWRHRHW